MKAFRQTVLLAGIALGILAQPAYPNAGVVVLLMQDYDRAEAAAHIQLHRDLEETAGEMVWIPALEEFGFGIGTRRSLTCKSARASSNLTPAVRARASEACDIVDRDFWTALHTVPAGPETALRERRIKRDWQVVEAAGQPLACEVNLETKDVRPVRRATFQDWRSDFFTCQDLLKKM